MIILIGLYSLKDLAGKFLSTWTLKWLVCVPTTIFVLHSYQFWIRRKEGTWKSLLTGSFLTNLTWIWRVFSLSLVDLGKLQR